MNHRSVKKSYSTEEVAWITASSLLEDFKEYLPVPLYSELLKYCNERDIVGWRGVNWELPEEREDTMSFKTKYQLSNLFKKFRFSKDLYSSSELLSLSIKKFMDNQNRLNDFVIDDSSYAIKTILSYTRGFISGVVGDYDREELLQYSQFAKKSSVGVPMREACEANRYVVPLSGSKAHIDWFLYDYLSWNGRPIEYIKRQTGGDLNAAFQPIECLEAVLVPKTFKSLRMIMPNTTIGGLYSAGLGKVLEHRLRRAGYDIRNLQKVHGEMARIGSCDRSLVTADQSLASDNITVDLIERTFPDRWAFALKKGRISRVGLPDGSKIETKTFSTMGIGFTFPLQTLLFLGLLKGISLYKFGHSNVTISVFGDDLIYDHRLHHLVVEVFPKLGLQLNMDKTFHLGGFRESCGQDYFHGTDVRPFQIGNGGDDSSFLSSRRYEAFLYKVINGLRRRWLDIEVPVTLTRLGYLFDRLNRKALVVPPDYPDTAGVKILSFHDYPEFLASHRTPECIGHGIFRFKYLGFKPSRRIEHRHEPYLWRRLQQLSAVPEFFGIDPKRSMGDLSSFSDCVFSLKATFAEEKVKDQPSRYRSKLTGKRILKKDTFILTNEGRYVERSGSSSFWT